MIIFVVNGDEGEINNDQECILKEETIGSKTIKKGKCANKLSNFDSNLSPKYIFSSSS